jgi:hypothetical protein
LLAFLLFPLFPLLGSEHFGPEGIAGDFAE